MGRRTNKTTSAPSTETNTPEVTVVDGEVAGVAPAGDAAAVIDTTDEAVLAALEAADETPAEEPITEQEPGAIEDEVIVAETDAAELDAEDEDAVLAALESEDDSGTQPAVSKRGRKRNTPAANASTPAVTRAFTDVAAIGAADLKANLDGINAKKVHEKAQNMIQAIETGKKLSGFTALAVKTLRDAGRVSSKTLVEAYQADGKSIGTARAQAQQMTALFRAVGLATPDASSPKELVLADNNLADALVA